LQTVNRIKALLLLTLLWVAVIAALSGLFVPDISLAQQPQKFTRVLKTTTDPQGQVDHSTLTALGSRIKSVAGSNLSASKAASTPVMPVAGQGLTVHRDEHNDTPIFLSGQAVSSMNKRMGKAAVGATSADIAMPEVLP